jgi:uncharacterized protein YndB with AHSA1/START domain
MKALRQSVLAALMLAATAGVAAQATPPNALSTDLLAETDGTRTLQQSIVVAAPLAAVWEALTTSDGWRGWAAPFAQVDFRLGGVIETSYQPGAQAGAAGNIRNQIIAYLPQRMLAIRNVQAPPNAPFDVPAFQSLHTVVLLAPINPQATRVSFIQPGYGGGEPFDTVLKHFRFGNGWSLEKLQECFDKGPVDWARLAAEAKARAARK